MGAIRQRPKKQTGERRGDSHLFSLVLSAIFFYTRIASIGFIRAAFLAGIREARSAEQATPRKTFEKK